MRRALLFLVVGVAFVGCGGNSFVGRSYDNFTAFYNTFYNAQQAYDEAVAPIEEAEGSVDDTRYLGLFPTPPQGNARGFDDVVQRAADVLRDHPASKWADDALLLIGKSYYYQRSFVGAEQKFDEVIALGGSLRDEAEFWRARARLAQTDYDGAANAVREALARDDLHRRWRARLQLVLAEVAVQREAWAQAETELTEALPSVRDRDLAARGYFLLGQVRETRNRAAEAADAYAEAAHKNAAYTLTYAALAGQARALIAADPDAALGLLRRMERDGKNADRLAEIALLRARALQAAGRTDAAYDAFHDLLYYGDVAPGNQRGAAHYHLATFYRDVDRDYALASAHFDTAATALTAPAAAELLTPWTVRDARETADVFGSFRDVAGRVAERDSLLYLAALPPAAFDSTIAVIRAQLVDEEIARREAAARAAETAAFSGTLANSNMPGQRAGQRTSTTGGRGTAGGSNPNGFLSHRDPSLVAQGRQEFFTQWGERPLVPNWRRREALTGADTEFPGDAGPDPNDSPTQPLTPDVVTVELDLSPIPRDSLAYAEMLRLRAADRYDLGNVLFLAMNRPDSAAYWYRRVVEEDEGAPVQPQALYALAEVQRALGDSLAATALYRRLLDRYPDAEFAGRVRDRLGLPPLQRTTVDSLALAEARYSQAYARWQDGAYGEAMEGLLETALAYRETAVAPKALLATGHVFAEWARTDSFDLYAAYPLAVVPDSAAPRVVLPDTMAPYVPPIDTTAVLDSLALVAVDSLTLSTPLADSLALADSLVTVPMDSLAARPDTAAVEQPVVPADTTRAEPPAPTVADPIRAPFPGPTEVPADSAVARVDTLAALPDTLVPQPFHLGALYASIVAHYPDTPFAERAAALASAYEDARPVPPPDTTATLAPPADSLALSPDSLVSADSLASAPLPADSAAVTAPTPADSLTTPVDAFPLQDALVGPGEVPPLPARLSGEAASAFDPDEGGLTWVVLSTRDPDLAAEYAEQLQQRGYPAAAVPGAFDGGPVYRVGVGQFADRDAATFARRYYPPNFPLDAWLFRLGSDVE